MKGTREGRGTGHGHRVWARGGGQQLNASTYRDLKFSATQRVGGSDRGAADSAKHGRFMQRGGLRPCSKYCTESRALQQRVFEDGLQRSCKVPEEVLYVQDEGAGARRRRKKWVTARWGTRCGRASNMTREGWTRCGAFARPPPESRKDRDHKCLAPAAQSPESVFGVSVQCPVSSVQCPASSVQRPVSSVQCPVSHTSPESRAPGSLQTPGFTVQQRWDGPEVARARTVRSYARVGHNKARRHGRHGKGGMPRMPLGVA